MRDALRAERRVSEVLSEHWVALSASDERRVPTSAAALRDLRAAVAALRDAAPGAETEAQAEELLAWCDLCEQEVSRLRTLTVLAGLTVAFVSLPLLAHAGHSALLALPVAWMVSVGLYVIWARGPRWRRALDDRSRVVLLSSLADVLLGVLAPVAAWRMYTTREEGRELAIALVPGGFVDDGAPALSQAAQEEDGEARRWFAETADDRAGPCPFVATVRATRDFTFEGRRVETGQVILTIEADWRVRVGGLDWGWIDERGGIHQGIPLTGIEPQCWMFEREVARVVGSSRLLQVDHEVVGSGS